MILKRLQNVVLPAEGKRYAYRRLIGVAEMTDRQGIMTIKHVSSWRAEDNSFLPREHVQRLLRGKYEAVEFKAVNCSIESEAVAE